MAENTFLSYLLHAGSQFAFLKHVLRKVLFFDRFLYTLRTLLQEYRIDLPDLSPPPFQYFITSKTDLAAKGKNSWTRFSWPPTIALIINDFADGHRNHVLHTDVLTPLKREITPPRFLLSSSWKYASVSASSHQVSPSLHRQALGQSGCDRNTHTR